MHRLDCKIHFRVVTASRILLGALLSLAWVSGAEIFVSPAGDDGNPGTQAAPLRTMDAGRLAARAFAGNEPVMVHFAKGTYYLPATVRFGPEDSGSASNPVVYAGEAGAVLSGGALVTLDWKPDGSGRYQAAVPKDMEIDQLWVDGRREPMARFPNVEPKKNVFGAWDLEHRGDPDPARDPLAPERVARWKDPAGAYFHAMHVSLWGDMHWLVKGKKADGTLDLDGGWQNNRPSRMHPRYRMVENVFEELDAPGEWCHDRKRDLLFYQPEGGTDLATARIEMVRLPRLLSFQGEGHRRVHHVTVRGFTFRHAARTFMRNKEPLLRSDWTICRDGAVYLEGAEDCRIESCEFDQVGGNTVFVDGYARWIAVSGCDIHDSGSNGICFVGNPDAVRSPLFRYGPQDYGAIDRTPGPLNDHYPADCVVEDCRITGTGRDEKQTAGVQIEMAARITVRDCSIYEVPRAGINIGDGCWGGHLIDGCDIFDTVLETGDHGSFNSWGRDRFWDPSIPKVNQEVAKDPALPLLDVVEMNILRHNRWRCDHGWDIDLDDGSSHYLIENNLLLHGGLKLREGFQRTVRNNVVVNNSLHPHCWYDQSRDIFTHNLVFNSYQPAGGMPAGKWGELVDRNWFVGNDAIRTRFAGNGCDGTSQSGDPGFIDPAAGDFRVREGSPALALGFKNFPMDDFGVKSAALKARVRKPVFPEIHGLGNPDALGQARDFTWLGITLRELAGEEFSAYGVAKEKGGLVVVGIAASSPAAIGGLKSGDLIQALNGREVRDAAGFQSLIRAAPGKDGWKLGIVRDQKEQEVALPGVK